MTLRYGAVLTSLRSLRGAPGVAVMEPTYAGVPYRDDPPPRGTIAPLAHIAPPADIYLPEHRNGASVVLVHGGAFVIGSRRMKPMRYLTAKLVEAGIAVCAIDYRMIFRGGRIEEATADVRDAFAFWSRRSRTLGLDPGRISLVGLSAGATLAMLAASRIDEPAAATGPNAASSARIVAPAASASPNATNTGAVAREESAVASVVACFGLYDAAHLTGPGTLLPRLLFGTGDRSAWRLPHTAPQTASPTLLLHGTDDGLVPVDQARRLAAHRESLGLPTKLVVYEGAPHGFFNLPVAAAASAAAELIAHVTQPHESWPARAAKT